MPLNLSDTELEIIINAAKPFQPGDRDPLLRALAQELSGYKQIGSVNFGLAKNLQRSFSLLTARDAANRVDPDQGCPARPIPPDQCFVTIRSPRPASISIRERC
jgi:hypothetical protein